jgi:hypothetical protein
MPEALKRTGCYRGSDCSFLRKTAPQESDCTQQHAFGLVHRQKECCDIHIAHYFCRQLSLKIKAVFTAIRAQFGINNIY